MPPGTGIAGYLDAIRYRRYSRSVLVERRRFLAFAVPGGSDAWLMAAPIEEIVATGLVWLEPEAPSFQDEGDGTTLERPLEHDKTSRDDVEPTNGFSSGEIGKSTFHESDHTDNFAPAAAAPADEGERAVFEFMERAKSDLNVSGPDGESE